VASPDKIVSRPDSSGCKQAKKTTKQMNTQTYKKTSVVPIPTKDNVMPVKLESQQLPVRIVFIGGGRIVAEIVDVCMN
jgi:hypothetical protein